MNSIKQLAQLFIDNVLEDNCDQYEVKINLPRGIIEVLDDFLDTIFVFEQDETHEEIEFFDGKHFYKLKCDSNGCYESTRDYLHPIELNEFIERYAEFLEIDKKRLEVVF